MSKKGAIKTISRHAPAKDYIKKGRHAGETLPQTLDLLAAILNNTHVLIACLDRNFNFLIVNEVYARADGREPDFYVGKNHFSLFPSEENEAIFRRVVETGEPYFTWAKPFEYSEHAERGVSHWEWSLKPVRDASGQVSMLVLTLFDVTSRVMVEEARRESEARLKKVLEVDAVGVMFWDLGIGCLVDANSTFLKMMGYSRAEVEAKNLTWQKFTPPEYHHMSQAEILKFQETGRVGPYEKEYFRKDGSRQWLLFSGSSLGGNQCVEFCIDISDRKKAEEALLASEARYRMLYETMRDPIVQVDMNGRILDCNTAYCQMLGYSPDEIRTMTYQQLTPERWHDFEAGLVRDQIIARGYSDVYVKEYRRRDGTIFPVELRTILARDAAGQPAMMSGIVRDITDRKQAEEELAAAHRQVQDIIDNTPAIVYALDLEGRFVLINAALAKLLNSTPDKMAGKKRHEFMPKEDADRHEANDRQVIKEAKVLVFEEYSNLKDRYITWYTTKFPLYDGQGGIYAVAGISADISERKMLEGELKKYNETLEESVRLRTEELKKQQEHLEELNQNLLRTNKELENFAYIASHDLQEPLRMVTSFTQLLAMKYKDQLDDNAKEYIKYAVDGAKRMYELINGLLAYSRISRKEVTFTEVDLNSVMREVKANLDLIIRERSCLIESGNLPIVVADKNQMIQLFQNLISNAIKFSTDQPRIYISSEIQNTHCHLSVKDNGIGIEPEYFDKIFEIFKRLMPKDLYEGTGLGLAICKRIVENHNGTIWVESEPGRGSIFHFTLLRH